MTFALSLFVITNCIADGYNILSFRHNPQVVSTPYWIFHDEFYRPTAPRPPRAAVCQAHHQVPSSHSPTFAFCTRSVHCTVVVYWILVYVHLCDSLYLTDRRSPRSVLRQNQQYIKKVIFFSFVIDIYDLTTKLIF